MDRGIKPVIVLSAEILMNFWYTLESCNQKGQMTQLKQGRDPQPPHPAHTSCLSRWIVLMEMEETMEELKDCLRIFHDSTTFTSFNMEITDHRGIYKRLNQKTIQLE